MNPRVCCCLSYCTAYVADEMKRAFKSLRASMGETLQSMQERIDEIEEGVTRLDHRLTGGTAGR